MKARIPVGTRVRSYDFEGRKDCYMEGVLEKYAPAPREVCRCNSDHLHIKVESVVFQGVEDNARLLACPEEQRYVYPAENWNFVEAM